MESIYICTAATYGIEFQGHHLSQLEKDKETDQYREIAPPYIVDVELEAHAQIISSRYDVTPSD